MAERARALADAGAHAEAARAFAAVGEAAGRDLATAAQAWMLAADAWRRDDRPAEARAAADRALALPLPTPMRAVVLTGRSGAALDAGALTAAAADVAEALRLDAGLAVSVVILDAAVGVALALGRLEEAAARTAALAAAAPPAAAPAIAFRRAALARLGGDLVAARRLLEGVVEAGAGNAAWAGPVAAAAGELGEIALLSGDVASALAAFGAAEGAWASAGRVAGAVRARGGQVRAALAGAGRVAATTLDDDVTWARHRGLVLTEVELRMARGVLRRRLHVSGAEADLDAAVSLAQGAGARLLEGRARLARRAAGVIRADDARARDCLAGDRPGLLRLGALTAR